MTNMGLDAFHSRDRRQQGERATISAAALRYRAFGGLLLVDALCLVLGFSAAGYGRTLMLGETRWALTIIALVPVYFFTAFGARAYNSDCLRRPRRAASRGCKALLLAVCTVILVAFAFQASEDLSRGVILFGAAATFVLIIGARYGYVSNLRHFIGGNPFKVMLLHDTMSPLPAGKFSATVAIQDRFDPEIHDPIMYDRLARIIASADRVVIACAPEKRVAWANALKSTNVQSEIFVPELDRLAPLGVSIHEHTSTVIVAVGPLGLAERFIKRVFDVAASGTAVLVLFPVLVLIALMVKLDSPGPILFKQVRIGCRNEMFRIWKFRSMFVEGSDGAGHRSASREDDRITRVGRLIRKTSLDELPQIINVLKGDMSIVGPRPHALGSRAAEKLFWEVDGRYWQRHSVKPGLTGLAQVRGYRGATPFEDDLRNRLQADLEYLEHWSIWRDIKIVLLTFKVLLHRNAY